MSQFIADALSFSNILLGFLVACFSWKYHTPDMPEWMRWSRVLIGLYWGILYIIILFVLVPGEYDSILFGRLFVRPAFTLSLVVIAVGSIQRYRANKL